MAACWGESGVRGVVEEDERRERGHEQLDDESGAVVIQMLNRVHREA